MHAAVTSTVANRFTQYISSLMSLECKRVNNTRLDGPGSRLGQCLSIFVVLVAVVVHNQTLFINLRFQMHVAAPKFVNILQSLARVLHIQLNTFITVHQVKLPTTTAIGSF